MREGNRAILKTATTNGHATRPSEERWQSKRIPALFDGDDGKPDRGSVGHTIEQTKGIGDDTTFNRALPLRGQNRVTSPYEQMPIVYAAVSEFAECVAGLKLKLWRTDPREDDEAQEVTSHRLVELFERPNKWQTWSKFAYAGATHRKTSGEDLWFLQDKDGQSLEVRGDGVIPLGALKGIWPVSGSKAQLDYDDLGNPVSWRYSKSRGGEFFIAPYWSVIAFQEYNPELPFRGLGAVEVVRADLELEWQAIRYQDALLRNGGDPGGFLMFDGEPPTIKEKREAQKDADHEFSVENAGRHRVTWGKNPKYVQNKVSPKDLQYLELFRHTRQRTASAIGVPLESIGYHENATYNNITEAHREKWRKIVSYLMSVEDVINNDLLARLDDRQARKMVARFDLSKVKALQEDQGATIQQSAAVARSTGITFNESLVLHGVETKPVSGGDVAIIDAGVRLMEDVLAGEPEPSEDESEPAEMSGDEPDDDTGEEPAESSSSEDDKQAGEVALRAAASLLPRDEDAERLRAYEDRRSYFKAHEEEVLEPAERRWKKAARAALESYQRAAIKRLRDYAENGSQALGITGGVLMRGLEDDIEVPAASLSQSLIGPVLPDASEWTQKFWDAFSGPTDETFREAVRFLAFEMGIPAIPFDGGFVQELLSEQKRILAQRVTENLESSVAEALAKVFQGDETVGTLQQHIARHLSSLEGSTRNAVNVDVRALRIARTESGKAANSGRHEQMKAAGTQVIEWLSADDNDVRDTPEASHKHLDGKKAALGEEFTDKAGNRIPHLTHPHAPGAPAAQVVNCRCATRPLPNDITPDDV